MTNKTKMDDFKQKLNMFNGFSDEQRKTWTVIDTIQDCIDRLLDDDLMMKNQNRYSFEQRTEMTKTSLFKNLFVAAMNSDGLEFELKTLESLVG